MLNTTYNTNKVLNMDYLITSHFLINMTILFWYLEFKNEKIKNIWKEVIITIFIGWLVILIPDDDDD